MIDIDVDMQTIYMDNKVDLEYATVPELKRQTVLHRLIAHVSSGHIFISCQDTALMAPSNTKKLLFFL